ncbi:hypothetical protein ABW636_08245 [Aquimarina sp. 2201CG1-2-11]|uniref:hypothetical protein n=1 Tax=Aquimarina discodermiae TaxID=3231043 RepID=UPI003461B3E4
MRNLENKETALINGGSCNINGCEPKEEPELPVGLIRIKKPFFPIVPILPIIPVLPLPVK